MKLFYVIVLSLMVLVSACAQQDAMEKKGGDAMEDKKEAVAEEVEVVAAGSSISASTQDIKDDTVVVDSATLDKPGFVVIHKVKDGSFADVIGNSALLQAGTHSNVPVTVVDYKREKELNAMLHYDDGDGDYLFPGPDGPVIIEEEVVMTFFDVIGAAKSTDIQILGQGAFDPDTLTINVGDSVTWVNTDEKEAVIIIFKDKSVYTNSNKFDPGEKFEHEFTEAGSYQYWRNIALASDGGTITVE